jgi:AcrR family transcriptional regulator
MFLGTQRTGGGREHRPERTRARLIDAAVSAFAARGYAATSVHDICALADLSVGSFYYHFDDKAGITLGILERENERVMQRIESIDLRLASSIEEILNDLLHGPSAPLHRALREAAEVERHVAEVEADLRRVTEEGLVAAITRARQESDRYRLEARAIAWAFLALIRAALAEPHDDESLPHGIAEIVHHLVVDREAANTS